MKQATLAKVYYPINEFNAKLTPLKISFIQSTVQAAYF